MLPEVRGPTAISRVRTTTHRAGDKNHDVRTRNVYEKKGERKTEVIRLISTAGSQGESSHHEKMQVQPEILLKIKDRQNGQTPIVAILAGFVAALPRIGILAPDSLLQSFALQEMQVQPEMLLKTKTE